MQGSKGRAALKTYPSYEVFLVAQPARRCPEVDFGRWETSGGVALIRWIRTTREVFALHPDGQVEVLGVGYSEEVVAAALRPKPGAPGTLAWAREKISTA